MDSLATHAESDLQDPPADPHGASRVSAWAGVAGKPRSSQHQCDPQTLAFVEGASSTVLVATFIDTTPSPAAGYIVDIDWGDGSPHSAGIVTPRARELRRRR